MIGVQVGIILGYVITALMVTYLNVRFRWLMFLVEVQLLYLSMYSNPISYLFFVIS